MTKEKEEKPKSLIERLNNSRVVIKFDARSYMQMYTVEGDHLLLCEGSKVGATDLFFYWLDNSNKCVVPCVEGWNKDRNGKEMAHYDFGDSVWKPYEIPDRVVVVKEIKGGGGSLRKRKKKK